MTERITVRSGDDDVVGTLVLPDGPPRGAVVATGPLTSVKEQASGVYARAVAERGWAGLAIDLRRFGESGGEPRQMVDPDSDAADASAAAAYLAERFPGVPVVGLGVCFGAGPMAVAVARDPVFAAFAGVAGVYTDGAAVRESMGEAYAPTVRRGEAAERRWRETGVVETIPAVAADGEAGGTEVAMPLDEAYAFYGTPRGAVPTYVNAFAVASWAHTLPFDAQHAAPAMRVPAIVVHSEHALVPPWAHAFHDALPASRRRQVWLESAGQIDFYDDPALIGPAADAVVGFLDEVTGAR
jgi:uncharacterized protein